MKLAALLAVLALAGCSTKKREPRAEPAATEPAPAAAPEPAPAPVAVAPVPAPVVEDTSPPADFPAECLAYAALVDKLGHCDALGTARDGLVNAYRDLRATWPHVPEAQRPSVASQCKAQADSLRTAAAATCQW